MAVEGKILARRRGDAEKNGERGGMAEVPLKNDLPFFFVKFFVFWVRVTDDDLRWFGNGRSAEELLKASFDFLLEREPNTSILSSFDFPVIQRYFPEYENEIRLLLEK